MRLFRNHYVRLFVTFNTVDESNAVMDAARIRISPKQLYRRMKEVLMAEKLSDEALKAVIVFAEKSSRPVENCELETSCTFVVEMEEVDPIADDMNLLSVFVETVDSVMKRCMPVAKDIAKKIADIAKCVPVVSSAFQMVVMCASYSCSTGGSCRVIVKSMIPVLHQDGQADEMLVKSVLKVQQELTDLAHNK